MSSDRQRDLVPRASQGTTSVSPQRPTVLIVDPNPDHAGRLAQALPPGWSSSLVTSAQAAMHAMRMQTPSLVVTELDLPDTSGVELVTLLHREPATRHILLMVVTQRSAIRDKIAALQAGADDYLVKPVDPAVFAVHVQLLGRLRRTLR
jgi:DNA-binding response OmpR family regulator